MPIFGLFGALAVTTIVVLWALMKAVKHGVQTENDSLLRNATGEVTRIYQLFLLAVFAFGYGPGIVEWAATVLTWALGVL